MKYLFGKQFFIIGLALIGLVLLSNHLAESQLTFSTNWDGGKRSVENWEIPGYFSFLSSLFIILSLLKMLKF